MGPLCRGAAEALEASRNALLLLIRAVSEWAYRLYETGRSKSRHDQKQMCGGAKKSTWSSSDTGSQRQHSLYSQG